MGRVLIIEDDAEMRAMLTEALQAAGHEVAVASDGKEGMKHYQSAPADLVITDLFMPNQEGLETITKMRRFYPTIPIIAISGNSGVSRPMLTVALQLGATAILHKPFLPAELLALVDKALASRHVPQE
jgi:DNA-binding response OmpR family regulator